MRNTPVSRHAIAFLAVACGALGACDGSRENDKPAAISEITDEPAMPRTHRERLQSMVRFMAQHAYLLNGTPVCERDSARILLGVAHVNNPNRLPADVQWRLSGFGPSPRSFLRVQLDDARYGPETARIVKSEWRQVARESLASEVTDAALAVLDTASARLADSLKTDSNGMIPGQWIGEAERMIGGYQVRVTITDNVESYRPAWAKVLVEFTHLD